MPEETKYPVTPETQADIDNRFVYHAPIGDQPTRYADIRAELKKTAEFIIARTPKSREQSLVLTKLEEAMFFANAAIARNEKAPQGGVA